MCRKHWAVQLPLPIPLSPPTCLAASLVALVTLSLAPTPSHLCLSLSVYPSVRTSRPPAPPSPISPPPVSPLLVPSFPCLRIPAIKDTCVCLRVACVVRSCHASTSKAGNAAFAASHFARRLRQ